MFIRNKEREARLSGPARHALRLIRAHPTASNADILASLGGALPLWARARAVSDARNEQWLSTAHELAVLRLPS